MALQSTLSTSSRSDSLLSQSSTSTGTGKSQQTSDSLAKLSPALAKARERVVAQEQSTATSLSMLGKHKAALASLGSTAAALGKLNASSTPASIQSTLEAFVADYNTTVSSARLSFSQGSNLGTSTVLGDLRRVLAQRAAPPSLHSLGLTAQADGTLKLDAAALKTALAKTGNNVAGALSQLGTASGKVAEAGLGSSSRLNSALTSLGSRLTALKKQEDALLSAATKLANGKQTINTSTDPISKAQQQLQQAYLGQSSGSTGL